MPVSQTDDRWLRAARLRKSSFEAAAAAAAAAAVAE